MSENLSGENSQNWKAKIKKACKWCGKELEFTPSQADRKFCNIECYGLWQAENRVGENGAHWQGGKTLEPYGPEWTFGLRARIRKRDNYTCAISGEVWQLGQPAFHVHHIDYDKKNCAAENLITLESNCHAKTKGDRDLWQALLEPIAQAREKAYGYPIE